MTNTQKTIKYLAIALAIFLTASIIGGIVGAVGLLGGLFGDDAVMEDAKTYSVSSDIHTLEISINAAAFSIKQGEQFSVESNLKHLKVDDRDGTLTIKETKKFSPSNFNLSNTDAVLTLYIPSTAVLEKVNIKTGAGRVSVDHLTADILNLELGAGDVRFDTLIAHKAIDIEGGAGRITVSDGALHNLDLDMGVGQLNLTSALSGESEFDLGVGESNITVLGAKENYNLDIEKGIGSVTLDGKSVSNVKNYGDGSNHIEINGGIGAIHVAFKELEQS